MNSTAIKFLCALLIGILIMGSSCPTKDENEPPTVTVTANPTYLDWGETATLNAVVADPDDSEFTYLWSAASGTFTGSSTGATAIWNAPAAQSGDFNVTVTVSDGDNETTNQTTLTVRANPQINIDKTEIDFGTGTTGNFTIQNVGTGTLSWTITITYNEGTGWLTPDVTNGTTQHETDQINLTVDHGTLPDGIYTGTINIAYNDSSFYKVIPSGHPQTQIIEEIDVQMEVTSGNWLINDDGGFESGMTLGADGWMWSSFERPAGWSGVQVTKVKLYNKQGSEVFDIDGFDAYALSNGFPYPTGENFVSLSENNSQSLGWEEHTVPPSIFNSEIFFIAVFFKSTDGPYFGNDTSDPNAQTSGATIVDGSTANVYAVDGMTWGFRVFVTQPGASADRTGSKQITDETKSDALKGVWLDPVPFKGKSAELQSIINK